MTRSPNNPVAPWNPGEPTTEPPGRILERNLAALQRSSPTLVERIRSATPHDGLTLRRADDGAWAGVLRDGTGVERALGSLRRPLDEARAFAAAAPVGTTPGFAVLGFGLGHHVAALAQRVRRTGVIFVYEPDVRLLRAVFERLDCSPWVTASNVAIFSDADDAPALSAAVRGVEGFLAMGLKILEHPPSRARLGSGGDAFSRRLSEIMRAVRTTVVTTLMQVDVTLRNGLMNLDRYAAAPGIGDLCGCFRGRAAVVVAAGPSLHRTIDVLTEPGVRDRVVVIAVQTVLKTLLERGLVPHFVTALDYAEISARFYEGLTATGVEGCTLVVEPKANPAILGAWPGEIRCPKDDNLDLVLGDAQPPEQRGARGTLPPGATVAHLAYYLARHLGCDPVILVGQDLGFTDGQYYAANAAIHRVWSGELNEHRTLEMMEWERIVRSKSLLHRATDTLGRPMYTDEQMATYLAQFERDFAADLRLGRTIIDATEGGVAKRGATAMTLRGALAAYAPASGDPIRTPRAPSRVSATVLERVTSRVRAVRAETARVAALSRRAAEILGQIRDHSGDQRTINALITEVHAVRDRVTAEPTGYRLAQFLNQTGTFNRFKADRELDLSEGLSPLDRQARQVERDIRNVTWIADAADEAGRMLEDTLIALTTGRRQVRPPSTPTIEDGSVRADVRRRQRVFAIIHADDRDGVLASGRDGTPWLAFTLRRLASARELDGIAVLAENPGRVQAALGPLPAGLDIRFIHRDSASAPARLAAVRRARAFARTCWRGGIGNLTCFDEVFVARDAAAALDSLAADAVAIVGADWALVDPALVDAAVSRYRENPEKHPVTFVQAPPGVGTCVVGARLVRELAQRQDDSGVFATLGGLLGYLPMAPQADPIAKPVCLTVAPALRDRRVRFIPDTPARADALQDLLFAASRGDAIDLSTAEIGVQPPDIVRLELSAAWPAGGAVRDWVCLASGTTPSGELDPGRAIELIDQAWALNPHAALSFEGRGDPLAHPRWRGIVAHAMSKGFAAVQVRTGLTAPAEEIDRLIALKPDVLSVDVFAHEPETYRRLTGADRHAEVVENIRRVSASVPRAGGLPASWVVPRLRRCDAVYAEIERFYDFWVCELGAAAIDPLPAAMPGERIAPLPRPPNVIEHERAGVVVLRADGTIADDPTRPWGMASGPSGLSLSEAWKAQIERFAPRASIDRPRARPEYLAA